jgi:hypothetical protein
MTHVKHLLPIPQVKKNYATSVRHLISLITSNMNAIQALSLNTSMHNLRLNQLLLSVLDSETQKEWELKSAKQQEIPATEEVIDFLEARCNVLELYQTNQSSGNTTAQRPQRSQAENKSVSHRNAI